ncbi:MAG TPA: hypothetical protein VGI70_11875 [Polyangiales bacterium]|jgi:hypothetical protein
MSNQSTDKSELQGEGNRDADREYREAATRHAQGGKSESEARQAEEALEGKEGDELRKAEKDGKARAKGNPSR